MSLHTQYIPASVSLVVISHGTLQLYCMLFMNTRVVYRPFHSGNRAVSGFAEWFKCWCQKNNQWTIKYEILELDRYCNFGVGTDIIFHIILFKLTRYGGSEVELVSYKWGKCVLSFYILFCLVFLVIRTVSLCFVYCILYAQCRLYMWEI